MISTRNGALGAAVTAVLLAFALFLSPGLAEAKKKGKKIKKVPELELTVLHNNDGESQLIDAGDDLEDYGGVARFKTRVDELRDEAKFKKTKTLKKGKKGKKLVRKGGAITLSSGDNFLAGPEFSSSVENGVPFYDTLAMEAIGYDAATIGNHEFDFGPETLVDFISGFSGLKFLSANADFSGEPGLQALVNSGQIAPSTVARVRGTKIGIVGAITPELPLVSSPRNVAVSTDVVGAVQSEVNGLKKQGVKVIIVSSHLQGIDEEQDLITQLKNVDLVIAGGGGELLANDGDELVPGDEEEVFGSYPLDGTDKKGKDVPIVTTTGDYRYVGRIVLRFNKGGKLQKVVGKKSGPEIITGVGPNAVDSDPGVQSDVVDPVVAALAAKANNVIADLQVPLDGTRTNVRSKETNQGNLMADSLLYNGKKLAAGFGVGEPDIAIQNGGGIRNDTVIGVGDYTELDTFDAAPFANFISVVEGITPAKLKELLERAVSGVEDGEGRFAQVAGFSFTYDTTGTAQEVDQDGNITTPGSRVVDVTLDAGGVPLIVGGTAVPMAPSVNIATIDFLAGGGDGYPYDGAPFTTLGVSYQQGLFDYIAEAAGLNGVITAAAYPEAGQMRITDVTP